MAIAKMGDVVQVHYTGKLDDGSVFDSSVGQEPLEVILGDGEVIPGFEEAIVGMEPGQSKIVKIESDNAYGPYFDEMVHEIKRSLIPPEIELNVGGHLVMQHPEGQQLILTILRLSDDSVLVDGNHPLAGKDLEFEISLVEILDEPTQHHGCGCGDDCDCEEGEECECDEDCDCHHEQDEQK